MSLWLQGFPLCGRYSFKDECANNDDCEWDVLSDRCRNKGKRPPRPQAPALHAQPTAPPPRHRCGREHACMR